MQQDPHRYGDALPFLFNEFFTFYFYNAKDIRNLALCNSIFQLTTFLWLKYGSRKFKFSFTSSCKACFKGNGYQVLNNENENGSEMKASAGTQNDDDQTFSSLWLKNRPDCSSFIFIWLQHFFGTVFVPLISTHLVTQATPGFTQEDKARWVRLGVLIFLALLTSKLYQSIICKILLLDKKQLEDNIRHHHHLMEVLLNTLSSFLSYAYMLWKDIGDLGDHILPMVLLELLGKENGIIYLIEASYNKVIPDSEWICLILNNEEASLGHNQTVKEVYLPCRGTDFLPENFKAFSSNQQECEVLQDPIAVSHGWSERLPCENITIDYGSSSLPIPEMSANTSPAHSCQPGICLLLLVLTYLLRYLSRFLETPSHQAMPRIRH